MAKYRKKPVVIEATQITEELKIETLEGVMIGKVGDWLITGVNGEKYPCKNDIFQKTYEPVKDATANTVGMSIERLALIRRTPMGAGDANYTIAKFLGETFPGVVFFDHNKLTLASAAGAQRMIAFQQDADVLDFWEPQPFTIYPEVVGVLKRTVVAKGRIGGVSVLRPLAIAFMDGI